MKTQISRIIGVDGGGTKTKFVCYDLTGNICNEVVKPSIHILQAGSQECLCIIKQGIKEVNPENKPAMIVFGLAGYGQVKELRNQIECVVKDATTNPYLIYSDVEIAIKGALTDEGVVVIAGTGSIGLSYYQGEVKRCGGWGYRLGDEGSAYYIGKRVLSLFTKMSDGRIQRTVLYDLARKELALEDDANLISYIANKHDRTFIASLAKVNYEAARQGDILALEIFKDVGKELGQIVNVLSKEFNNHYNISYIGGVFQSLDYFKESFENTIINTNYTLHAPKQPPEYGAYLYAKEYLEKH